MPEETDRPYQPVLSLLAENVKVRRQNMLLSQKAFGDRCGMTQSRISKIERGSRDFTLSTLDQLSRALQVPPDVLLRPLR